MEDCILVLFQSSVFHNRIFTATENDLDNLIKIINTTDFSKAQIENGLKENRLYEFTDFKKDTVSLDRVFLIFENDKLKNVKKQW